MDNIKILLNGFNGAMGRAVRDLADSGKYGVAVVSGVDARADDSNCLCAKDFETCYKDVDCILDFSNHSCTNALLEFATSEKLPLVIATTGQTDEELSKIKEASKIIPIFISANMSMGVALLLDLAKKTAKSMGDATIEIVETHHIRKVDAPSGTAKMLVNAIKEVRPELVEKDGRSGSGARDKNEIGVQSLRYGNIVGIHEVIVSTDCETITLKHEAHSRSLFAEGAIKASQYLIGKKAGLYTMQDLIKD